MKPKPSEDVAASIYTRKVELLPGIEPPEEEFKLEDWIVTLPAEEDEEPDDGYGDPRTFLFKKGDRCELYGLIDEDYQKFNGTEVIIDIPRQCPKSNYNPSGHGYYLVDNPLAGHYVYEERLRLI
jgi:hypothetical protein